MHYFQIKIIIGNMIFIIVLFLLNIACSMFCSIIKIMGAAKKSKIGNCPLLNI